MIPGSSTRTGLQDFIDATRVSGKQRIIVLLTFLIMVADGMDITIVSHLFPRLIAEWGTSIGQVTFAVTAGVVAMALGALVAGPAADRWGRKWVIVIAFALFNLTTAATGLAPGIEAFIGFRLVACIGLGAVMPIALTLVADWVPSFRRAQFVALVFSGVALGSIVGAYLAATLIPAFGWQTMILVAGLVPLIVLPFFIVAVPEPPNTLIKRGRPEAEVRRTLALIAPGADTSNVDTSVVTSTEVSRRNVFAVVLSRALATTTALIWVVFFITQGLALLVLQYLPILLQQQPTPGLSTAQSGQIVAMWGWGGLVGQVLVSFVMKKFDRFYTGVLAGLCTIAGAWVIVMGNFGFAGLVVALFLTGIAFASMPAITNAIAANAYPPEARGTGVGTAGFVGRLGSLASGLTGGMLIAAGWTLQSIFAAVTVPVLIAIGTFLALRATTRRRARAAVAETQPDRAPADVRSDVG